MIGLKLSSEAKLTTPDEYVSVLPSLGFSFLQEVTKAAERVNPTKM